MLGTFRMIFVIFSLSMAANAWATKMETVSEPKFKHLKSLVGMFEALTHDEQSPWEPETYGQKMIVKLSEKAESEQWSDVLKEMVSSQLTHIGEDYQASQIDIQKMEKSLNNLRSALDHMFTYGTQVTAEKLKQFSEILQIALYRRPNIDLFLLIEGSNRGECRSMIILDRRNQEAITLGSCQIR